MRWLAIPLLLTFWSASCGGTDRNGRSPQPQTVVGGAPSGAEAVSPYPAPETVATTLAGDPLRLDSLRGRTIVVNFWATWCGPCLREIPDLADLHRTWNEATVIGVAYNDPDSASIRSMARDLDIPYPVVIDGSGDWAEAFGGVFVMPSTFLVDPDGLVVARFTGLANPDSLRAAVTRVSAAQP